MLLMIGVSSPKRHVIVATAGEPIVVPFGNTGTGIGDGRMQSIVVESAVTSLEYSIRSGSVGLPQLASGCMAAKLAASRAALLSVTQPRNTRPNSSPNNTSSRRTGRATANSTRLWPCDRL